MASPWWVIEADVGSSQLVKLKPTYQVVQGASKPDASLVETGNGTHVVVTGPFATQAAAKATIPAGSAMGPGTPVDVGKDEESPAAALTSWEQGVATFLKDVTSKGTYLRIAKVVVGSVMIIVGLAKITGAGKAVTDVAKGALP
jgi:hypothetical protein